jgi:hypothetical protein
MKRKKDNPEPVNAYSLRRGVLAFPVSSFKFQISWDVTSKKESLPL